jgi:3-oxosteroid 1-dehydrogenase
MSRETDFIIVGAGAAGLLAAVAARRLGLDVLVVEATAQVGGTTSASRGAMWLPGNDLMIKLGMDDPATEVLDYLNTVLGDTTEASTLAKRAAYANSSVKMVRWLTSSRIPLMIMRGLPDYHLAEDGGKAQGRVLATQYANLDSLGEWANRLRSSATTKAKPGGLRKFFAAKPAATTATRGEALVAELLRRATANGVEFWFDSPLKELVAANGAVSGVVVEREGRLVEVSARRGVLLACGGFEANQYLREEYLPLPTDTHWSLNEPLNTGAGIEAGIAIGAETAAMSTAWWVPVILTDQKPYRIDKARQAPHGIIVDQAGDRFFSEAAGPSILGRYLYSRSRGGVHAVPSFLIMDNRHRSNYELGPWKPGSTPRKAIESGDLFRANTLNDLAQELGVDRAGLIGTVVRFNNFAHKGRDEDFRRGESDWDRFGLGGSKKKNPGLSKLDKSPYWAVKLYPGDSGTKGGLLTDEDSRVLHKDGSVITGLYACGGAAASIMKSTSPGPGAGLGEALIGAYRAVLTLDTTPAS